MAKLARLKVDLKAKSAECNRFKKERDAAQRELRELQERVNSQCEETTGALESELDALRIQFAEAQGQAESLRVMLEEQEQVAGRRLLEAVEAEQNLWRDLLARANRQSDLLEEKVERLQRQLPGVGDGATAGMRPREDVEDVSSHPASETPLTGAVVLDKEVGVPRDVTDKSDGLPESETPSTVTGPVAWMPQHLPPLPNFSGEDKAEGEDMFEEWLEQLELVATLLKWDEPSRLVHLVTRLKGQARAFYRSCPSTVKESYGALVQELRRRFKPVRLPAVQTSLFHQRVQGEKESVDEYAQALRKLFLKAYPVAFQGTSEAEGMGKSVLCNQFVAGLAVGIQRKLAGDSGTFDELLVRARFEEAKSRELDGKAQGRSVKTSGEKSTHPVTSGNTGGVKTRDRRNLSTTYTCHGCGSANHFVRNCPLRRRGEAKETQVRTKHKVNGLDIEKGLTTMKTLGVQSGQGLKIGRRWETEVLVADQEVRALIDTGSPVSVISSQLFYQVCKSKTPHGSSWKNTMRQEMCEPSIEVKSYNDTPVEVAAETKVNLRRGEYKVDAVVLVQCNAPQDLLLGTDLLESLGIRLDLGAPRPTEQCVRKEDISSQDSVVKVRLLATLKIPARHACTIKGIVSSPTMQEGLFVPRSLRGEFEQVESDPALVTVSRDGTVVLVTRNKGCHPVSMQAGEVIGELESATEVQWDEMSQEVDVDNGMQLEEQEGPEVSPVINLLSTSIELTRERKRELCQQLRIEETPITLEQRDDLTQLLFSYHDVFALKDAELGTTHLVKHSIDTGANPPIKQYARRMPHSLRSQVKELLWDLLSRGVIGPTRSPWASPVVIVRKHDDSLRLCVDYRKLNAITKVDVFPLPRIDDCLDSLRGNTHYSTLDLMSGYWQIALDDAAKEKTAFATPDGTYEFNVMPFGLVNAPSTFQRLMQEILTDLIPEQCLDYVDDVLVLGSTFERHLTNLEQVFSRLRKAGLKLKPTKCTLVRPKVTYLGYVVSREGVETDPKKLEAVRDFPTPNTVAKLRSFLGLTSYYRRFIKGYATVAKPLHALTGNVPFTWSKQCQEAFDKLKRMLTSAPLLVFPDFSRPFILETDASGVGLGAVLAQKQSDGTTRPISFASRTLQGSEKNYSSSDMEALAVVWATKHFRHYIYGYPCTVYTDNQALKSLLRTPHPSGRLARWGLALQDLDVTIEYRAGRSNLNADALSRNPVAQDPSGYLPANTIAQLGTSLKEVPVVQEATDGKRVCAVHGVNTPQFIDVTGETSVSPDCCTVNNVCSSCETLASTGQHIGTWREAQLRDPTLRPYFDYLERETMPEDRTAARKLAAERSSFEIEDGVLYHVERDGSLRVIPPEEKREQLFEDLHGAAHLGFYKTFGRFSAHYWWPGMRAYVKRKCAGCETCLRRHAGQATLPPMTSIPVGGPFERMGVDVLKLPKTHSGKQYVVVFMDYLTKWPEVFPVANQEALTIAKLLAEKVVPVHGVPKELLSDRGTNFLSKLMEELYRLLGIKKVNSTAYHPRTDGMVERFNRTLQDMLAKVSEKDPRNWDKKLPQVLFAYRTSPHESTKETPFKLLYGREATLPTTEMLFPPTVQSSLTAGTYLEEMSKNMAEAWAVAQTSIKKSQTKQKRSFDKKASGVKYQAGDRVYLYRPSKASGPLRKLAMPYEGPYRVMEISSAGAVIAREGKDGARPIRVAIERLRRCPEEIPATQPTTQSEDVIQQEEEIQDVSTPPTTSDQETEKEDYRARLRPRLRLRTIRLERGTCNQPRMGPGDHGTEDIT